MLSRRSCATSAMTFTRATSFAMNDPFDGGMHLPDIFVFQPIFFEGQRLAFAATCCHHTDVGGRVAGSNASDSTEIYQEGLRIPPLKLYDRGKPNNTLLAMIEKNVRVPVQVLGDLRAQLAACHIAEQQFQELAARFGASGTAAFMTEVIDYAERLTRAAISELPDGVFSFEDWIDDDGIDFGKPIRLFVTFTKEGRSPDGRLDRHLAAGQGGDQQHALLHQGSDLLQCPLAPTQRHPEQCRRVPCDRGDAPPGTIANMVLARRMRRSRSHRLSHGGLLLRRARPDGARSRVRRIGRRQYRRLDRRLSCRSLALHLCRFRLRHLGRSPLCRRLVGRLQRLRQHGLDLGRGDRGRTTAGDPGL